MSNSCAARSHVTCALGPDENENREDRTPSLLVRTLGAGYDDSSLFMRDGRETARHVAAYCQLEETTRRELPFAMCTHRYFDMAVKDPTMAASLTRWLMRRQRVGGYRVALQIADNEAPVDG